MSRPDDFRRALRAHLFGPTRMSPAEARRGVDEAITGGGGAEHRERDRPADRAPWRGVAVLVVLAGLVVFALGEIVSVRFDRSVPPPAVQSPQPMSQRTVILELPSGSFLFVPLGQEIP